MKGSKEFFEELQEGQEWCNCFMTKEVYNGIDFELKEQIVLNSVRQHNDMFKDDEHHKKLIAKKRKANKELMDYEFKINHK